MTILGTDRLAELAVAYERARDLWTRCDIDQADDDECNRRTADYNAAADRFLAACREMAGPDACGAIVGNRLVIAGDAVIDPDGDPWALASIPTGRIVGLTA